MTRKAMAPIATFLLVAFANPSEAKRPPHYHIVPRGQLMKRSTEWPEQLFRRKHVS
jgi:hypothetical protein